MNLIDTIIDTESYQPLASLLWLSFKNLTLLFVIFDVTQLSVHTKLKFLEEHVINATYHHAAHTSAIITMCVFVYSTRK